MAGLLLCKVTGASQPWFLPSHRRRSCLHPLTGGPMRFTPMLDFPVAPPIVVKDTPRNRELTTLGEARNFVDEMLHERRLSTLREIKERLDGAKTEEDAIEAIGSLRELLALEDLTDPEKGSE